MTFIETELTFRKVKQLYRLKPGSSGRTQQTARFLFHCKCLLQFTSNFISTWTVENKLKITNTGLLVLRCTIQIELNLILKTVIVKSGCAIYAHLASHTS